MTRPTFSDVRAAFAMYDKNGNGKVVASELGEVMAALGTPKTDEELKAMMAHVDTDGKNSNIYSLP